MRNDRPERVCYRDNVSVLREIGEQRSGQGIIEGSDFYYDRSGLVYPFKMKGCFEGKAVFVGSGENLGVASVFLDPDTTEQAKRNLVGAFMVLNADSGLYTHPSGSRCPYIFGSSQEYGDHSIFVDQV